MPDGRLNSLTQNGRPEVESPLPARRWLFCWRFILYLHACTKFLLINTTLLANLITNFIIWIGCVESSCDVTVAFRRQLAKSLATL